MQLLRNIRSHWVLIGLVALCGGVLTFFWWGTVPAQYSASATMRVLPGSSGLDSQQLRTAAQWYESLGQVPDVVGQVGRSQTPPLTPSEVGAMTSVTEGGSPGQIEVVASAPTAEGAQALARSMATAIDQVVAEDPILRLGDTSVATLVPATIGEPSGFMPLPLSISVGLLIFAGLATLIGFFPGLINWRMTRRLMGDLGAKYELRHFGSAAGGVSLLAADVVMQVPGPGVALVESGSIGLNPPAAERLRDALAELDTPFEVLGGGQAGVAGLRAEMAVAQDDRRFLVRVEPRDGSAESVATASVLALPAILAVSGRAKWRSVDKILAEFMELGTPVAALIWMPKSER